jgi:hypothetical protein
MSLPLAGPATQLWSLGHEDSSPSTVHGETQTPLNEQISLSPSQSLEVSQELEQTPLRQISPPSVSQSSSTWHAWNGSGSGSPLQPVAAMAAKPTVRRRACKKVAFCIDVPLDR